MGPVEATGWTTVVMGAIGGFFEGSRRVLRHIPDWAQDARKAIKAIRELWSDLRRGGHG